MEAITSNAHPYPRERARQGCASPRRRTLPVTRVLEKEGRKLESDESSEGDHDHTGTQGQRNVANDTQECKLRNKTVGNGWMWETQLGACPSSFKQINWGWGSKVEKMFKKQACSSGWVSF